jgi:hypothetical protein
MCAATSVGFVANLFKQSQLYPVASGYEASEKDKKQGVHAFVSVPLLVKPMIDWCGWILEGQETQCPRG